MKTLLLIASLLLAPALLAQTADASRVPIAKTVTLTVKSDGTPPLQFQWFKDGVAIPGATGPQLVLANFGPEHGGLYHATSANEAGSVVSNKVQLTPVKQPSKSTITVNIAVGSVNP